MFFINSYVSPAAVKLREFLIDNELKLKYYESEILQKVDDCGHDWLRGFCIGCYIRYAGYVSWLRCGGSHVQQKT